MPPQPTRQNPQGNQPITRRPNTGGTSAAKLGVLDRITAMSFDDSEGLNWLFYGESGTGKTTLWSSFPGPILVMICSGGQKPGELRSINTPEMRKKVQTVTLDTPSEIDEITRALSPGGSEAGRFNTVVLDHVSGFQDLKLMSFKGLSDIPQQKMFGMATQQDWGIMVSQCKEHLVKLLSLPMNVVIIAQERIFTAKGDEDKERRAVLNDIALSEVIKPKVGASLVPSLTGWLNPACDYVVQTYKRPNMIKTPDMHKGKETGTFTTERGEGVQFCARTGPHDIFMTKFRVPGGGGIPESIVLGDSIKGVYTNPSGYERLMSVVNKVKGA